MAYSIPQTLDEALHILCAGGTTILAGGTDVYPSLPGRDLPPRMMDISALNELRGIKRGKDGIRIGGLARWSEIRNADLPTAYAGLQAAARQVGGIQIQNAGTIAGNLCNASPAADGVPPLLTLEARVELQSARGSRQLDLEAFLTGARQTAREEDEILTAIHVPSQPTGSMGAFEKLGARRYLVISIAMVAVLVQIDGQGRIGSARIAVGACSPVALRLRELESELVGQSVANPDISERHLVALSPIDDPRGTASYRREVVAELCRRAIRLAGARDG